MSLSKRRRAARKAARTRARKRAMRRAAARRYRRRSHGRRRVSRRRRRHARRHVRRRRRMRRNPIDLSAFPGAKPKRRRKRRKKGRKQSRRYSGRRARAIKKYRRVRRRGRVRKGRGYAIRRARRSILYTRAYGKGLRRAYLKRYRMRTNPLGGLVDVLKHALPVAGGFLGARLAAANAGHVPGLNKVLSYVPAQHQGPVVSLLAVVAANYLTRKVGFFAKHRTGILAGVGLNAVLSLVSAYAPDSVKGYIGAGDFVYNDSMSGFMAAQADYVATDDYIDTGDYVETGAMEDMAAYEDVAADSLEGLGPIPHRALPAMTHRGSMVQVPSWTPEMSRSGLHTGIFGKGGTGWSSW